MQAAHVTVWSMVAISLIATEASTAEDPDLTGDWSLSHKGRVIEVGRWVQLDKYGEEFGGREVRGAYNIIQDSAGNLTIQHGSQVWLFGILAGDIFDTRRVADGYELGPDWGVDLLQIRVRPGANELEIWKDRDGTDFTADFVFSDYILVRRAPVIEYPGASPDFVL